MVYDDAMSGIAKPRPGEKSKSVDYSSGTKHPQNPEPPRVGLELALPPLGFDVVAKLPQSKVA